MSKGTSKKIRDETDKVSPTETFKRISDKTDKAPLTEKINPSYLPCPCPEESSIQDKLEQDKTEISFCAFALTKERCLPSEDAFSV